MTILILLLFVAPLLFFILQFAWSTRNNHLWEAGIFPSDLAFNRDHLMEAYICLGARIIMMDRRDSGKKVIYINQYFNRYFKESNYNFSESISYSYSHPIKVKTVSKWINKNIKDKSRKLQILYFLSGLAMIDGIMNEKEQFMIEKLGEYLRLSPADVRTVLAMYEKRREEHKPNDQQSTQRLREICCKILGVSVTATSDEMKKAYRRLVKIHHPDKFSTESSEQQEIAKERFIEIQKAYDYLSGSR